MAELLVVGLLGAGRAHAQSAVSARRSAIRAERLKAERP